MKLLVLASAALAVVCFTALGCGPQSSTKENPPNTTETSIEIVVERSSPYSPDGKWTYPRPGVIQSVSGERYLWGIESWHQKENNEPGNIGRTDYDSLSVLCIAKAGDKLRIRTFKRHDGPTWITKAEEISRELSERELAYREQQSQED